MVLEEEETIIAIVSASPSRGSPDFYGRTPTYDTGPRNIVRQTRLTYVVRNVGGVQVRPQGDAM